jgi:murein DD-endopeptidase MepM/ murein hydrolase activator NlpD
VSARHRGITLILQPDGAAATRSIRISVWAMRVAAGAAVVLLLAAAALVALYGPIVRTAARVPGLEREVAQLRADNSRVRDLAAALDSVEQRYAQVREMVGADIVRDPVQLSATLPVAATVKAAAAAAPARFETGAGVPSHWPLDEQGYLTRGQVPGAAQDEAHPGIDIAVPVGSVVRASAGGSVADAGEDPQYGNFVLLQHASGYQTMYGHLSRVVVAKGDSVEPGAVLGLTGNSGRSTAPHLHFEVRHDGQSVDPLSLVKEDR